MKQALKDKWLAALRSGEYKQARGKLKNGEHIEYVEVTDEMREFAKRNLPGPHVLQDGTGVYVAKTLTSEGEERVTAWKNLNGIGHCCLGVLLDITSGSDWTLGCPECEEEDHDSSEWQHPHDDGAGLIAGPEDVVGLETDDMNKLAELNDSGNDFSVIADWIAANVKS